MQLQHRTSKKVFYSCNCIFDYFAGYDVSVRINFITHINS